MAALAFLGGPWDDKEVEVRELSLYHYVPYKDMVRIKYLEDVPGIPIVKVAVYKFVAQLSRGPYLMMYVGVRGY